MNPEAARAMYARQISAHGEEIVLRRYAGSTAADTEPFLGRVTGFTPEEMLAGVDQGARKVILLAEDVEASGFALPFRTGGSDKVVVRGRELNVQDVDDNTRRVAGVLVAYELEVKG